MSKVKKIEQLAQKISSLKLLDILGICVTICIGQEHRISLY